MIKSKACNSSILHLKEWDRITFIYSILFCLSLIILSLNSDLNEKSGVLISL